MDEMSIGLLKKASGLTMDKDVKELIKDYSKSVVNRKTKAKGHLVN